MRSRDMSHSEATKRKRSLVYRVSGGVQTLAIATSPVWMAFNFATAQVVPTDQNGVRDPIPTTVGVAPEAWTPDSMRVMVKSWSSAADYIRQSEACAKALTQRPELCTEFFNQLLAEQKDIAEHRYLRAWMTGLAERVADDLADIPANTDQEESRNAALLSVLWQSRRTGALTATRILPKFQRLCASSRTPETLLSLLAEVVPQRDEWSKTILCRVKSAIEKDEIDFFENDTREQQFAALLGHGWRLDGANEELIKALIDPTDERSLVCRSDWLTHHLFMSDNSFQPWAPKVMSTLGQLLDKAKPESKVGPWLPVALDLASKPGGPENLAASLTSPEEWRKCIRWNLSNREVSSLRTWLKELPEKIGRVSDKDREMVRSAVLEACFRGWRTSGDPEKGLAFRDSISSLLPDQADQQFFTRLAEVLDKPLQAFAGEPEQLNPQSRAMRRWNALLLGFRSLPQLASIAASANEKLHEPMKVFSEQRFVKGGSALRQSLAGLHEKLGVENLPQAFDDKAQPGLQVGESPFLWADVLAEAVDQKDVSTGGLFPYLGDKTDPAFTRCVKILVAAYTLSAAEYEYRSVSVAQFGEPISVPDQIRVLKLYECAETLLRDSALTEDDQHLLGEFGGVLERLRQNCSASVAAAIAGIKRGSDFSGIVPNASELAVVGAFEIDEEITKRHRAMHELETKIGQIIQMRQEGIVAKSNELEVEARTTEASAIVSDYAAAQLELENATLGQEVAKVRNAIALQKNTQAKQELAFRDQEAKAIEANLLTAQELKQKTKDRLEALKQLKTQLAEQVKGLKAKHLDVPENEAGSVGKWYGTCEQIYGIYSEEPRATTESRSLNKLWNIARAVGLPPPEDKFWNGSVLPWARIARAQPGPLAQTKRSANEINPFNVAQQINEKLQSLTVESCEEIPVKWADGVARSCVAELAMSIEQSRRADDETALKVFKGVAAVVVGVCTLGASVPASVALLCTTVTAGFLGAVDALTRGDIGGAAISMVGVADAASGGALKEAFDAQVGNAKSALFSALNSSPSMKVWYERLESGGPDGLKQFAREWDQLRRTAVIPSDWRKKVTSWEEELKKLQGLKDEDRQKLIDKFKTQASAPLQAMQKKWSEIAGTPLGNSATRIDELIDEATNELRVEKGLPGLDATVLQLKLEAAWDGGHYRAIGVGLDLMGNADPLKRAFCNLNKDELEKFGKKMEADGKEFAKRAGGNEAWRLIESFSEQPGANKSVDALKVGVARQCEYVVSQVDQWVNDEIERVEKHGRKLGSTQKEKIRAITDSLKDRVRLRMNGAIDATVRKLSGEGEAKLDLPAICRVAICDIDRAVGTATDRLKSFNDNVAACSVAPKGGSDAVRKQLDALQSGRTAAQQGVNDAIKGIGGALTTMNTMGVEQLDQQIESANKESQDLAAREADVAAQAEANMHLRRRANIEIEIARLNNAIAEFEGRIADGFEKSTKRRLTAAEDRCNVARIRLEQSRLARQQSSLAADWSRFLYGEDQSGNRLCKLLEQYSEVETDLLVARAQRHRLASLFAQPKIGGGRNGPNNPVALDKIRDEKLNFLPSAVALQADSALLEALESYPFDERHS